jgi:hypothetical protein
MGFWQTLAIQQTLEGVVFALLAVAGILAQRRWGIRASVVIVALAWPVFVGTVLLNELMRVPQLLELNTFAQVFRVSLRTPATISTVALAVALWLARRVGTVRRAILWGVGAGAVWAYVMPVPLMIVSLGLMYVVPLGKADYYHVDLRPMGLEVLESGKPQFRNYNGDAIPLRYRAELDGREIEIRVDPVESSSVHFQIHALTPGSPLFTVDGPSPQKCGDIYVADSLNQISVYLPAGPDAQVICYQETGEAALTIGFTGSDARLTLHDPVVKAGSYYFYDSL